MPVIVRSEKELGNKNQLGVWSGVHWSLDCSCLQKVLTRLLLCRERLERLERERHRIERERDRKYREQQERAAREESEKRQAELEKRLREEAERRSVGH